MTLEANHESPKGEGKRKNLEAGTKQSQKLSNERQAEASQKDWKFPKRKIAIQQNLANKEASEAIQRLLCFCYLSQY